MYRNFVKRLLDFLLATILLVLTSPLFIATWILLVIQNEGNAFFLQERPGFRAKPFRIIKFKTMIDKRDSIGNLLPDIERLTPLGRFVRKLSLDELPQLINVLKGDMSLIGPRPLLFRYLPLYSKEESRRHDVRPGITGWAQVNGRNSIPWKEKFKYDIYYVDNMSFVFDVRILFLTIVKVLKREGINQTAERPMQPFNGSN